MTQHTFLKGKLESSLFSATTYFECYKTNGYNTVDSNSKVFGNFQSLPSLVVLKSEAFSL